MPGLVVQAIPEPTTTSIHTIPVLLDRKFVSVCSGFGHVACLSDQGELFMVGDTFFGQCGPTKNDVEDASARDQALMSVLEDKVMTDLVGGFNAQNAWERGNYLSIPHCLSLEGCVASVACGGFHTAVVTRTGQLFTFGSNSAGQLGRSTAPLLLSRVPTVVPLPSGLKAISVAATVRGTMV